MFVHVNIGTKEDPLTGAIELYNPETDEVLVVAGDAGSVSCTDLVRTVETGGTFRVQGGITLTGKHRNRLTMTALPAAKFITGGSFHWNISTKGGRTGVAEGWIEPVSVQKIKKINDLYPKLKVVDAKALAFAEAVLADPAQAAWHEEMDKFLKRRVQVEVPAPEPPPVTGVVDIAKINNVLDLLEEAIQLLKGK